MTFSVSSLPVVRRVSVFGSIPIVTLGLLIVTFALLRAPWPPDPQSVYGTSVSYFERLKGKQVSPPFVDEDTSYKSKTWYARRALDALALGLLVAGYISVALAIMLDNRRVLVSQVGIGALGILYSGTVGLFAGPILTLGGFALILFGAGLYWLSGTLTHNQNGA